jgi:hypothetical protein
MITSCTFIPSQRVKDLLCKLWIEFGCRGDTRTVLIELRAELGKEEFARFEKDLARGMERKSARTAVHQIIRAAILRGEEQERTYRVTKLRTIYQPA